MARNPADGLKAGWSIVWRVVLFVVAFVILSVPLIVPFASALENVNQEHPAWAQLYFDLAGAVAMLVATVLMTRLVDRRPFGTVGFTARNAGRDLLLGLAVGTFWLAGSVGVAWSAGWAVRQPLDLARSALLLAAVSVFLNVVTQQLLLCGYIFQTIRGRSNTCTAMLASSLLFSAYHAAAFEGAWLPAVNVFAAGVLFCLAFVISHSLWFPISIHFAWNFLIGSVLGLTVSGSDELARGGGPAFKIDGPSLFTGGSFGLEGGLVVTLMTAIVVTVLLLVCRGQGRETASSARA